MNVIGNSGELVVKNILEYAGFSVERTTGYNPDYDLACKYGNLEFTCEVKFDKKAAETDNLAIEMHNTKQDKPSGLSSTKADLWVVVLKDDNHAVAFVTTVKKLKKFVTENEPLRTVEFGGDKNARLALYRCEDILQIFERLDTLKPDAIRSLVRRLLK